MTRNPRNDPRGTGESPVSEGRGLKEEERRKEEEEEEVEKKKKKKEEKKLCHGVRQWVRHGSSCHHTGTE